MDIVHQRITPRNAVDLMRRASSALEAPLSILKVDIDSFDAHVLEMCLQFARPTIVFTEYRYFYGLNNGSLGVTLAIHFSIYFF